MSVAGAKLNSDVLREVIHPLTGQAHDYDPVLSLVGDASLCLLGEATRWGCDIDRVHHLQGYCYGCFRVGWTSRTQTSETGVSGKL